MFIPQYYDNKNQLALYDLDVLIVRLNKGKEGAPVVFYGDGHSVNLDPKGSVTWSDPLYKPLKTIHGYQDCTVYAVYFPTTTRGLSEAAMKLAGFINTKVPATAEVVLHGHSKCGCCFINAAQWITRCCTIVSVSAPLQGTPIADLGKFSAKLNPIVRFVYLKIFSDHKVDKDICPGSDFINGLGLKPAIERHDLHIVTSRCGFTFNPVDWVLCLVDKVLGINGDGIVPLDSQYPIGVRFTKRARLPRMDRVHFHQLVASHATSLRSSLRFIPQLHSQRG